MCKTEFRAGSGDEDEGKNRITKVKPGEYDVDQISIINDKSRVYRAARSINQVISISFSAFDSQC